MGSDGEIKEVYGSWRMIWGGDKKSIINKNTVNNKNSVYDHYKKDLS